MKKTAALSGRIVTMIAAMSLAASVGLGQGQAPGSKPPAVTTTGLIIGAVVEGDGGSPVSGAVVTISGQPDASPTAGPTGVRGVVALGQVLGRVMTAADGRFLFRALPKGSYTLTVTKPGYVQSAYGRRSVTSMTSQAIDLADGQRVNDAKILIWKSASITGTVVDEAGEPMVGINVRVFARTVVAGRVKLLQGAGDGSQVSTTDDRGIYRLSRLVPGEFIVVINSPTNTVPVETQDKLAAAQQTGTVPDLVRELTASGALFIAEPGIRIGDRVLVHGGANPGLPPQDDPARIRVYPTTFYGGATSASRATIVTLKPGESRMGVDFQIRPVATVRVAGTVQGPDGRYGNLALRLMPTGSDEYTREPPNQNLQTITDAQGAFEFLGVTPGTYLLRADRVPPRAAVPDAPIPDEATLWASVPVTAADHDIVNLSVMLQTGFRIKGRLVWDGTAKVPAPARMRQIRIVVDRSDGLAVGPGNGPATVSTVAAIDVNGGISTFGIAGGSYVIGVSNIPNAWALKSATVGGRDVSVASLDLTKGDVNDLVVTLTDRPSEVSGSVRNSQGAADLTADVVVFPADPQAWVTGGPNQRMVRLVRVTRDGTYSLIGLPPGDYCLAAIPDESSYNWNEARMLDSLSRLATRVHITEGAKQRQDLQTVRIK